MLCIRVVHMFFELEIMVQGDKVKKGQTVAYIEQLGTFVPVEVRSHHICWLHRCIQTQHLYGQLPCIVAHCWCWHDLHMCAVIYACVSNQSCHSSVMTSRSRHCKDTHLARYDLVCCCRLHKLVKLLSS